MTNINIRERSPKGNNERGFKNEMHASGELARDPVIRYTPSGKAVATLTIVTRYKQWSEFHRVVLWEALAEKVAECIKGDFLRIVGRLQTRSWDDKTTGQKKYQTEIIGFQVSLPSEPTESATGGTAAAKALLRPAQEVSNDDIPF